MIIEPPLYASCVKGVATYVQSTVGNFRLDIFVANAAQCHIIVFVGFFRGDVNGAAFR